MLDAEGKNIDAVMIATPDHMQHAAALLCMQHGKHVLLRKAAPPVPSGNRKLLAEAAVKYKVRHADGQPGLQP